MNIIVQCTTVKQVHVNQYFRSININFMTKLWFRPSIYTVKFENVLISS